MYHSADEASASSCLSESFRGVILLVCLLMLCPAYFSAVSIGVLPIHCLSGQHMPMYHVRASVMIACVCSGAVKRVGRCDAYATEFDLEAEEYVPLPKVILFKSFKMYFSRHFLQDNAS